MKHAVVAVWLSILLTVCGCKHEGAITPQEPVITKPEKRDFGLVGTWQSVSPPEFDTHSKPETMTIAMREDGVYDVRNQSFDALEVSFRANALDKHSNVAIIDVEGKLKGDPWFRYLAVVKRENDRILVSWVEGKRLAKLMFEDGHSAVIEHETLSTKVYAKRDNLLDSVRKHAADLIGEPDILVRLPDEK